MARLPVVNGDQGNWGAILNDYLLQSHTNGGALKGSAVSAAGAEMTANKGIANGYASLDSNGLVPTSQLPTTAGIGEYLGVSAGTFSVASGSFGQVIFDGIEVQRGTSSLSWDSGTPTRVNILQSGVYAITATVYWGDAGATGPLFVSIFTLCGFQVEDQRGAIGDSTTDSIQSLHTTLYLQSGHNIFLNIEQGTGGTLTPFITMLVTRCA